MRNSYLFPDGYRSLDGNGGNASVAFHYYNQDHLGNIRVVFGEDGTLEQKTHYYPFGAPYTETNSVMNAGLQPYKYNGKELDRMHGLNTYDYGARQYNPFTARWLNGCCNEFTRSKCKLPIIQTGTID